MNLFLQINARQRQSVSDDGEGNKVIVGDEFCCSEC